jgi:hypothetical protein
MSPDPRPAGWMMFGSASTILGHAFLTWDFYLFAVMLLGYGLGSLTWIGIFMGSQAPEK